MTPMNSNIPSETSRQEDCLYDDDEDIVMTELQPQCQLNQGPSQQELNRWFSKEGMAYLSFTK